MRPSIPLGLILAVMTMSLSPAVAQEPGLARPDLVLREVVAGMPRGERQEVRVLTASLKPYIPHISRAISQNYRIAPLVVRLV